MPMWEREQSSIRRDGKEEAVETDRRFCVTTRNGEVSVMTKQSSTRLITEAMCSKATLPL